MPSGAAKRGAGDAGVKADEEPAGKKSKYFDKGADAKLPAGDSKAAAAKESKGKAAKPAPAKSTPKRAKGELALQGSQVTAPNHSLRAVRYYDSSRLEHHRCPSVHTLDPYIGLLSQHI